MAKCLLSAHTDSIRRRPRWQSYRTVGRACSLHCLYMMMTLVHPMCDMLVVRLGAGAILCLVGTLDCLP